MCALTLVADRKRNEDGGTPHHVWPGETGPCPKRAGKLKS
jgi:hypothetical protein